jgi:translocation and assembly module TamB
MIQRAIAEYKLLQDLRTSGFQDTEGVFGGEIQYRIEFR